jgi:phosphate transport system permease protein
MDALAYRDVPFHAAAGRRVDMTFVVLIAACAVVTSLVMLLIAVFLFNESIPILQEIGIVRFFTDEGWWPRDQQYNLMPMLTASLLLTFGALLIAAPVSIVFAVFCVFYASRRVASILRRLVDISAAIPTVIYGFWGLVTIVPLLGEYAPPGASLLAGILVLSLMIFPTITVLSHSAILAVPNSYLHAGAALGVCRFSLIRHVVLPSSRSGIVSAVILGAARAIGETMVVLMVCGNIVQAPSSLLDPVRALTANIALEMPYAMDNHRSSLYATGLIVLLVVTCLVLLSEIYAHRQNRGAK